MCMSLGVWASFRGGWGGLSPSSSSSDRALQHPLGAAERNPPVGQGWWLRVELVGGPVPPRPRSARVTVTLKNGVISPVKGESVPSSCQLVREYPHVGQGVFLVFKPGGLLGASVGAYETQGHGGAREAAVCLRVLRWRPGALGVQAGPPLHPLCRQRWQLHLQHGSGGRRLLPLLAVQHQRHALFGAWSFALTLIGRLLGGGALEPLLAAVGLAVHAGADLYFAVLRAAVGLVADHQDDNEDQHRSDNYTTNNDDHGASQELAVHEAARADFVGGVKLHTADHASGR